MATRRKSTVTAVPNEPVRVEVKSGQATLHLEGVVGVAQATRLHQLALKLASAGRDVNVRCEHLQHLDCAAAQVLLALRGALEAKGASVTLRNLPESTQQTLRHAGLAEAL